MRADLDDLLAVAIRVATDAAAGVRTARERILAGADLWVGTKTADTDVVTAVDKQTERDIRAALTEARPDDAVLGEEEGTGAAGSSEVTWVVDPIDGTVNFLYGFPWFAVSVAAQIDGASVVGAVVEPVSGRRWTAVRGGGAWLDGRALRVNQPRRLDLSLVGTGFGYVAERRKRQAAFVERLLGQVRDIRRPGAGALDLCSVAAGWVDGYIEHGLARWDWAAGALVAAEAGASVALPGEDPALGGDATFAAAPSIAGRLRDAAIAAGAADV